jgi:hypothetical protein
VFGLRKTVYSQKNSLIIIKSIENRSTWTLKTSCILNTA